MVLIFHFIAEEAEDFNREWERKARTSVNAIGYGRNHSRRYRDELPTIADRCVK